MKRLAIITARGGSKRIPRKNIKEFCGKPIMAYSIETALETGLFDEVMVSTDDEEIASIALEYGAKVPFLRSNETANDFATTKDVIMEVIDEYSKKDLVFEEVICIYPTAPLIRKEVLQKAVELLENNQADSVMPVVRFGFPPQRAVVSEGEYIKFKWPENSMKRSQDLEPLFHDVGQFYLLKTDSFMKQQSLVMEKTCPIEISEMEAQDIDNEDDWKLAELKFRLMRGME